MSTWNDIKPNRFPSGGGGGGGWVGTATSSLNMASYNVNNAAQVNTGLLSVSGTSTLTAVNATNIVASGNIDAATGFVGILSGGSADFGAGSVNCGSITGGGPAVLGAITAGSLTASGAVSAASITGNPTAALGNTTLTGTLTASGAVVCSSTLRGSYNTLAVSGATTFVRATHNGSLIFVNASTGYNLDLWSSGLAAGDCLSFQITSGASNVVIRNSGGTTITTLTTNNKRATVVYDGSAWVLISAT